MSNLSLGQAKAMVEGYNAKIDQHNSDSSDGGKCPYRGGTLKALGYSYGRNAVLEAQLTGNTQPLPHITPEQMIALVHAGN